MPKSPPASLHLVAQATSPSLTGLSHVLGLDDMIPEGLQAPPLPITFVRDYSMRRDECPCVELHVIDPESGHASSSPMQFRSGTPKPVLMGLCSTPTVRWAGRCKIAAPESPRAVTAAALAALVETQKNGPDAGLHDCVRCPTHIVVRY